MSAQEQKLAINNTDPEKGSALQKSLSAGHWFLLDTVMQKILIFGTFFITARLLTPADFGLIALAGIYPGLLDSLTAIAFETAIIQKKPGEEMPYMNAVWTFNLVRSVLLFAIVFFTAPLAAHFLHNDNAVLLFRLSGLYLIFQGLNNIGQRLFTKALDYKKLFFRDIAMYGSNSLISIATAFFLHSYWALFIGNAVGILAGTIATYVLSNYRPRFEISYTKLKHLLPYSQWVFAQGLINRLSQTIESVLIGRFTNTTSIGLYGKAKTLANTPTSPLSNIIEKIGFSALVSVQDSKAQVREGLHKSFDLTASIALAFLVVIFIGGDQLVGIFLGAKWLGIIPFLKILTVVATLDALIMTIAGTMFNALSKPNLLFQLNTLSLVCLSILFLILIPTHGTMGAAMALLISSIITNGCALILIKNVVDPNWRRISETFGVISIALLLPLLFSKYLLYFSFSNTHVGFLLIVALMGCLYAAIIMGAGIFFKKGPYNTLLVIIKSFRKKSHLHTNTQRTCQQEITLA